MGYIINNGIPYGGSDYVGNPNELANGGFWLWSKGDSVTIVQGTNTSDIRTTDGWLAQYMMVSKGDGCAILEDKDTSQTKWFMQLFPFTLPQDDYTITIKVKSLNGTMAVKFEGDSSAEYRDLSVGVNVFTKNVAPQGVVLKGSPTKMEIEYIKLERGTKSTPIKKRELLTEYYLASVCKKTNL